MQRFIGLVAVLATGLLFLMAGCNSSAPVSLQDGTYTAEFKDFDSYGYKDFMTVTVTNGVVSEVVYDGKNEAGQLKTEDAKYESDMMGLQDTYPAKYTQDLENQLLEKQDIAKVDVLAGATYSSDSFTALYTALQDAMAGGNTATVVVENVPVK